MTTSPPVLLESSHDVAGFDCGYPILDNWLERHALANQQRRASRTYVACDGVRVVGYYALAAGAVAHADAPGRVRRNMPDPVPMAILARLAVDRRSQGAGVGIGLLKDAMTRVVHAADLIGIRGLLVDAIDDRARAFYQRFGFVPSPVSPLKLMITIEEVMRELKKAPK